MTTRLYRRSIQIVSDYRGVELQIYRRDENDKIASHCRIKTQNLSFNTLVRLDRILQRAECQRQSVFRTMLITNAFFGEQVYL